MKPAAACGQAIRPESSLVKSRYYPPLAWEEDPVSGKFEELLRQVAEGVDADYREAREYARSGDSQRAGHEGESTWQRILSEWGPNLPVVTRKYIVGPGGSSKEVDIVVLRPDYPQALLGQSSILASGVAAAFSVKLTLKRPHIKEALEQKRELLNVSRRNPTSIREVLCGPFPFGILAHSSDIGPKGDFEFRLMHAYNDIASDPGDSGVTSPREELDCLMVANEVFLMTRRMTLDVQTKQPSSTTFRGRDKVGHPGEHLAKFITWIGGVVGSSPAALGSLTHVFGSDVEIGFQDGTRHWPITIYPEHIRKRNSSDLWPPRQFG